MNIAIMAVLDLLIVTALVACTGGIAASSFVSLLLLVPVMVMVVGVQVMGRIMALFTILVLLLVIVRIPVVGDIGSALLGSYEWILSFRGSDFRRAYEGSTIWSVLATVWGTYLQYLRAR